MKDFAYYSTPKTKYFGYEEEVAYKQSLLDEINDTPMTAKKREKALADVKQRVREHVAEQNKPYNEEQKKLTQEFWEDARDELGYTAFLSVKAQQALEYLAYERGHSSGYAEVYCQLQDFAEFAKAIADNPK